MLYLLAILLPPLAVLLCGKPIQALLNCVLCVVTLWVGAVIHAMLVVSSHHADQRSERMVREMAKAQAVAARLQPR